MMVFRQFFHTESSTFSYLIASGAGREAIIIDPVLDDTSKYLQAIRELNLRLVRALDTHTHADHITGLGKLRSETNCITVMGEYTNAECVSERVSDGDVLTLDGMRLEAIYTPGHTDESFSFYMPNLAAGTVFTGDVLLIRGTGRTDFQGGDAYKSWDSITNKLFRLNDDTTVFPAHDYKGWNATSIGEEKNYNPRLAGKSESEYVDIMNNLRLPDPKLMDVAVPANLSCGNV